MISSGVLKLPFLYLMKHLVRTEYITMSCHIIHSSFSQKNFVINYLVYAN